MVWGEAVGNTGRAVRWPSKTPFVFTFIALGAFFISQRRLLRWAVLDLFLLAPSILPFSWGMGDSRILITLPGGVLAIGMGIFLEQCKGQVVSLFSGNRL